MEKSDIRLLLLRARGLGALRGVLDSRASRGVLATLRLLAEERPDPAAVADAFGGLWQELAREADQLLSDAWQSHLVVRLLETETSFSLAAERGVPGSAVTEQASRDLRTLRMFFDLDAETQIRTVERAVPEVAGMWAAWTDPRGAEGSSPRQEVARKLAASEDWAGCTNLLANHFARHGTGEFGRTRAFRWRDGRLVAVERLDPIRLSSLVGYEREREPLVRNTERLLASLPAHHVLLYGLPGTGKSSTVKAIASEYVDRGLRLVEVAKEDLGELPRVLDALRNRKQRFILFVDDLSFEESEVEYKALKALLEGSVEETPANVRLYATSNRRNIVRESFSEREEGDDVHLRDTMQEKLSLAARFGLRVTFPPPDRKRYLEIVAGLARERGIEIPAEDLVERALLWERWQAGRSGRTARQFVDELEAELIEGG